MKDTESLSETEYTNTIIAALKETQAELKSQKELLPASKLDKFEDLDEQTLESYEYNGEVLGAFFNSLLQKVTDDARTALCPHLVKNFRADGFPAKAREGVCSS